MLLALTCGNWILVIQIMLPLNFCHKKIFHQHKQVWTKEIKSLHFYLKFHFSPPPLRIEIFMYVFPPFPNQPYSAIYAKVGPCGLSTWFRSLSRLKSLQILWIGLSSIRKRNAGTKGDVPLPSQTKRRKQKSTNISLISAYGFVLVSAIMEAGVWEDIGVVVLLWECTLHKSAKP